MSHPANSGDVQDPWDNPQAILDHTQPKLSNAAYLHYADLNEFIKQQAAECAEIPSCVILDYGAGASPYKMYFPKADYRRADITETAYLDYTIKPDSTIPEQDATFDVILSTQVAEHVINPSVYFKECFRLLKPGGKLILTTHGIWQEHGSPYDFQRWTEEGLKRDLQPAGFKQIELFKLTCGVRAATLFFTLTLFQSRAPQSGFSRFCFKAFRLTYSKTFCQIHRLLDKWFPDDRIVVVKNAPNNPAFYAVIAAVAKK